MPVVVTNAGRLHYLALIKEADLLARLFGTVLVPDVVVAELVHVCAPQAVREWVPSRPTWLDVELPFAELPMPRLDGGERAAIWLARAVRDDKAGAAAAREAGFVVTGTLGVLSRAAETGLTDLRDVLGRLRKTNLRCRPSVMAELLAAS